MSLLFFNMCCKVQIQNSLGVLLLIEKQSAIDFVFIKKTGLHFKKYNPVLKIF